MPVKASAALQASNLHNMTFNDLSSQDRDQAPELVGTYSHSMHGQGY